MHREADRLRVFSRRAALLGGAQLGMFGLLGARLYYLQVVDADRYALLADENRINQRLLPPARGRIFDRQGVTLATNVPTYRVMVIREQAGDVRARLRSLAGLIELPPERIEEVMARVMANRDFVPVVVRDDLTWSEVARVAVHAHELPGITLDAGLVRDYPAGPALAHVLGYVGPVSEQELTGDPLLSLPDFRHGKAGIEKLYNETLRGSAGISRYEVNALGREIKEFDRADGQPGQNVELTIDLDLQRFVFERLSNEISASAVVVDVHTGEVLALASYPAFDPASFTTGLGRAEWRALTSDPLTPLVNKAISGLYPPGSTFKMIVGLAALEAGIRPEHEVYCPGFMKLGRYQFHCWKRWGHGNLTLVDAIAQSCDVYFYDVARKVGVDAIAAMARRFGLGSSLGIDLPGERAGLVPDKAWKRDALDQPWHQGETLIVGIGQGYMQTTPLQLATMTARIANGGRAVRPHVVRGSNGGLESQPTDQDIGVSEWALRFIKDGMSEVVNGASGTARAARLPFEDVLMAGKTGTSQVQRISRAERATGVRKNEEKPWPERDHALFVAFAPLDEPRYAVAVVVEHGGSGSKAAAPVARDIMAKAIELDPSRPRAIPTVERPGPATTG
ncbi:MAG: penicillin-binding protein 2 [Geminicoccaceae bacterium]|nr:penicillin-binding protein 2 [Geminicoccaceae bacterium]